MIACMEFGGSSSTAFSAGVQPSFHLSLLPENLRPKSVHEIDHLSGKVDRAFAEDLFGHRGCAEDAPRILPNTSEGSLERDIARKREATS